MKKMILILVLAALAFVWHFNQTKPLPTIPTSAGAPTIKTQAPKNNLVPAPYNLHHKFTTIQGRPWKDKMEAVQAVNDVWNVLLKARGAPELNTEEDREIWPLVEQYAKQAKPFRYSLVPLDRPPSGFAAMYDCGQDLYVIGSHYMTVTELALGLYHEVQHEADCSKAVAAGVSRKDNAYWGSQQCQLEERGYAAAIRLILAFNRLGFLPSEINGDLGYKNSMQVNLEVWTAIAQGRFCELTDLYRSGR